jgi:hypothetical protein
MSQKQLMDGWRKHLIQHKLEDGKLILQSRNEGDLIRESRHQQKQQNARWWRTNKRKDPNAMDVDALTIEERETLLRQGKCFRCKKTGHMVKDCPPEQAELLKQKKVDLARFAYTTIKALTKEQRESFTKMVMENKDEEDFWNGEPD